MQRQALCAAVGLLMPMVSSAFCGTYVGGAGAELYNEASQLAIARQGKTTTLTMWNDVRGNFADFAMVIPVPEVPAAGDVRVTDAELFARLDAYSAPRLVSYTCDELYGSGGHGSGGRSCIGCAEYALVGMDSNQEGSADDSVVVEAEYVAGEYEIVVLSAEDSAGLLTWLDQNGYAVPETTGDLLAEYIEAGSYFFAAKVSLEKLPDDAGFLSPLQVTYQADVLSLPIRLGTANSPGIQDLIIYVVNEYERGKAGISNYDEVAVEDECLFDPAQYDDFGAFYAERAAAAFESASGASWMVEYAWGAAGCDPCTGTPPEEDDLEELGWMGNRTWWEVYFTRLHMRYAADRVPQDVVLYHSNLDVQEQARYVEYRDYLEAEFPVCDEGWRDDPGSCFGPALASTMPDRVSLPTASSERALAGAFLLAPLLVLRRRRTPAPRG